MKITSLVQVPNTIKQSDNRFGGVPAAPLFLKTFDFMVPGATSVNINKLVYASVIASRIKGARSSNERRERLIQDPTNWYFWSMGSSLMQTAFALLVIPRLSKQASQLMVTPLGQNVGFFKKIIFTLFSPSKLWLIATGKQLSQRQNQIIKTIQEEAIKKCGKIDGQALKQIDKVKTAFTQAIKYNTLNSLVGLIFSFLILGIGINVLNIAMTKANAKKKKQQQAQQSAAAKPLNRFKTVDMFKKPMQVNRFFPVKREQKQGFVQFPNNYNRY